MAVVRQKTPTEINVETVNKHIDEFIEKTKHLIDAKLELPLEQSKKPTKKLDVQFTLGKFDSDLQKENYASHAAYATHFVLNCIKNKELYDQRNLIRNHLEFLQAVQFDKKAISHNFLPRIVDDNSRLLAGEYLKLLQAAAKLSDPLDGILSAVRKMFVNNKELFSQLNRLIESLELDVGWWDRHCKKKAGSSSVATVMKIVPDLKQQPTNVLPSAPVAPAAPPLTPAATAKGAQNVVPNPKGAPGLNKSSC